jgi:hypothetical protein
MYHPEEELRNLLSFIENEQRTSDSDTLRLVSLTRQLIEKKHEQQKYKILNFYCNWCLHTNLSKLETGYRMLLGITEVIVFHGDATKNNIPRMISEVISFKRLREEFLGLYASYDLPRFLFEGYRNWKGFLGQIVKEIHNKPIGFPDEMPKSCSKTANKIYEQMLEITKGDELNMARKLYLSDQVEGKPKGEVWWIVQTAPRVRITGKLQLYERKADFAFE